MSSQYCKARIQAWFEYSKKPYPHCITVIALPRPDSPAPLIEKQSVSNVLH